MTLAEGFQFTQSNLQDYRECQRRFQLRYLLQVSWPALISQPANDSEDYLQLGTTLHYMIRQHLSGVPVESLIAMVNSLNHQGVNELLSWWQNYLSSLENPQQLGALLNPIPPKHISRLPEATLSTPISGYRAIARYDLLILDSEGKVTIVDWKTNRNRPPRRWLQGRIQSRLYPYVLVKAGKELNQGIPVQPEQVEMCYWFTNFPDQPEYIIYSTEQFHSDEGYISNLAHQIDQKSDNDFSLTHDDERCKYCVYRSLCNRGTQAGSFQWSESPDLDDLNEPVSFDLQQIDEIEF